MYQPHHFDPLLIQNSSKRKGVWRERIGKCFQKRNSCQSRNFFFAKTKHLQKCKDQSKTEVGDNLLAKYRVHGSTVEESDQIIKGNSFHQLVNILAYTNPEQIYGQCTYVMCFVGSNHDWFLFFLMFFNVWFDYYTNQQNSLYFNHK